MHQNVKFDRLCLCLIKQMGYMEVVCNAQRGRTGGPVPSGLCGVFVLESNRAWAKFGLGIKSMPVGLKWSGRLMALQYPIITFFFFPYWQQRAACLLELVDGSQLALNFILNSNQAGLWWLIEYSLGIPGLPYNFLARQYLHFQNGVEFFKKD